ncbi:MULTISPECIES: hypothetical protein [unclassified Saccharicrinis]|uniref:hypothetical protein n=1 Tax=unclassified Saccharicrinis TaxID=2646859 RepID=UPI003D34D372
MKNLVLIFGLSLLTAGLTFSQGTNNDYEFDTEDLSNIFDEMGINVFKFPFELKKGEYISVSYEMYENGKRIKQRNIVEDIQVENGLKFNHHHSPKDTTVYHRLYFYNKGDSLLMQFVVPGISITGKVDIARIGQSSFSARVDILKNLPHKREIMYYYANYKNSEKEKESKGWLNCPAGKSNEELIDRYDLVILFFAERINAQRAKHILEEEYYKNKSDANIPSLLTN